MESTTIGTDDKIQAVIFRMAGSKPEFLILHRIPEHGGNWQSVTGSIEEGETADAALKREVFEETGIREQDMISYYKIMEFYFEKDGVKKRENVFEVEVRRDAIITDENNTYKEHDKWKWVGEKEAILLLKWDGDKNAIKEVASRHRKKRR